MDSAGQMRKLRRRLRELLPGPLRERYHRFALRRDFGIDRAKGARPATRLDPALPPGLNVIGYFTSASGVGQSARSLAAAAELRGVPVARVEASAAADRRGSPAPHDINLFHVNADGAAGVVEELGPRQHAGRANVGFWYWEAESFPAKWADRFDYFDEIWVATDYCRSAIERVSPIPVEKVPPAVTMSPDAGVRRHAGLPAGFLFGTVFDALSVPERKNPLGTIRAFCRAFGPSKEAALLVHCSNAEKVPGLMAQMREAGSQGRVAFSCETLGRPALEALLASCDAYVSLHRAEGFGFLIAEAMALGKPVVATDYSGSADFLDETTGFPVRWKPYELPRAVRDYARGTLWADPDEEHAAALLRRVVEDHAEAARRAEAARHRIAELYHPKVVGERVAIRLAALRARLRKKL